MSSNGQPGDIAHICLDLDAAAKYEKSDAEVRRQIKVFKETEPDNKKFVSLHDILSDDGQTYDNIRDKLPQEKKQTLSRTRDRFRNYPFSVVKVFDLELEDAVEVFQRINQAGKRLTRFDLVAANCWSPSFNLAKSAKEFNDRVKQRTDFGAVEPITLVQAMALVAFKQCKTEHELRLKPAQVEELWPRVSKAIGDALDWMRDNYGVIRGDMLPYDVMLAVLACYFCEHGTNVPPEHKAWIDRWFWRSAFSARYGSSQSSQMASDAKAFSDLIDGKPEVPNYPLTIKKDDIRNMKINRASAARNAILCLLACAQPKHFVNGTDISLAKDHFSDLKDPNAHHIFPKNYLKKILKHPVEDVHLLPNFCFISADLNNKIRDRAPSDYFAQFKGNGADNAIFKLALRSHLISATSDSPIWIDDYDDFLMQRSELIWASILAAVGEGDIYDSGASVPRDQARLAVDEIEVKLRRFVHEVLRSQLGDDYWKAAIPGDLQAKIKGRISDQNRSKIVTRIENSMIKLQYTDIMDLYKIIEKNWDLFKDQIEDREDLKTNFLALKNYRNPLGHVREMDIVPRKRGEAAIVWFRRMLDAPIRTNLSASHDVGLATTSIKLR